MGRLFGEGNSFAHFLGIGNYGEEEAERKKWKKGKVFMTSHGNKNINYNDHRERRRKGRI